MTAKLSEDNVERFNEAAKEWDKDTARVELAKAVSAAMRKGLKLTGTERCLEFGCGTGLITLALAPFVAQITAMDSSPAMLEVLRSKLQREGRSNVTVRTGVVPDQLPDETFDIIFSSMVLHHIEDVGAVLQSLFGHLAAGGRVAFGDLDAEDGSFHDDKQGVAHHGFNRDKFGGLLSRAGFTGIHLSTSHWIEKQDSDGAVHKYSTFLAIASKVHV